MDAKEIFKQLTCGAIFTKSTVPKVQGVRHLTKCLNYEINFSVNFQQSTATSASIKKEIKVEDVPVDLDVSIKSEDESDNEGESSGIQILSDSAMPILLSKKKKKVTPEQLKNWETEKVNVTCMDDDKYFNSIKLSILDKSFTKQIPYSREGVQSTRSARNVRRNEN